MAKRCISCKRDLAKGQKTCFVCGSSQNIISYYFSSGVFILSVMLVAALISYWYVQQANKEIDNSLIKLELAQQQIEQAESRANLALSQLKSLQQQTAQAKNEGQEAAKQALNQQAQAQIAAAEKKAEDAQKNVNWLSRQNTQLKQQVETLTQQLADAQQANQSNQGLFTEAQVNQRIQQAQQADAVLIQGLREQLQNVQQQLAALETTDN